MPAPDTPSVRLPGARVTCVWSPRPCPLHPVPPAATVIPPTSRPLPTTHTSPGPAPRPLLYRAPEQYPIPCSHPTSTSAACPACPAAPGPHRAAPRCSCSMRGPAAPRATRVTAAASDALRTPQPQHRPTATPSSGLSCAMAAPHTPSCVPIRRPPPPPRHCSCLCMCARPTSPPPPPQLLHVWAWQRPVPHPVPPPQCSCLMCARPLLAVERGSMGPMGQRGITCGGQGVGSRESTSNNWWW